MQKNLKDAKKLNFKDFCLKYKCGKLEGYEDYYKIRIGRYRIWFMYKNNTIEFIRFLPRKIAYKFFPPK